MCRRAVVCAVAALIATTASVAAQATEPELQRRIDALVPLVEHAEVEAREARAARIAERLAVAAEEHAVDTVVVHGMRILASPAESGLARELFEEAWNESYQGLQSPAFSTRTFVYYGPATGSAEVYVAPDEQRQGVMVSAWNTREVAKERVRTAIGEAIAWGLADTALGRWMLGNPFLGYDPAQLYRGLAIAGSALASRCADGDVQSCITALGLGLEGRDPLEVWYDAEERAALATTGPGRTAFLALADCEVHAPTPDDCQPAREAIARRFPPGSPLLRRSLVGFVLQRAGSGAVGRLVEDASMSPEEALAYVSGLELEELVAAWHDWIVSSRAGAYAGLGGGSALALGWILLFAMLATRSTRWRFA